MTENPLFQDCLRYALDLAERDDDGVEEAREYIEAVDLNNGWNGELVEAWRARWREVVEDQMACTMLAMTAHIQQMLKE